MACNCKKAREFEEKNGVPQEESIVMKLNRYFFKVLFFVIAIVLAIVIIPYIILYAVYAMFFTNGEITLPKFLRKYMEQ